MNLSNTTKQDELGWHLVENYSFTKWIEVKTTVLTVFYKEMYIVETDLRSETNVRRVDRCLAIVHFPGGVRSFAKKLKKRCRIIVFLNVILKASVSP